MSTPGVFVPGLFSQAGRETAFEIENLQNQLNLVEGQSESHGAGDPDKSESRPKAAAKSSTAKKPKAAGTAKSPEDLNPRTPGGELAKAIQEKLRTKDKAEDGKRRGVDPNAEQRPSDKKDRLTAAFNGEGKDGNWASKFTATYDIGSINHRNEQRPGPAWYKVRHDEVLNRPPAWDFNGRPQQQPLAKPESDENPLSFMTGLDVDDQHAVQALTARQRQMMKDSLGISRSKPKGTSTAMGDNSERGPLGKVGRVHVLANEVSCASDSDLLDQDIKGYPKLRYPCWDFEAPAARGPLIKADSLGEPGKYDVNLDCVKAVSKSIGIGFGKALPRSSCVSLMGYIAPPAGYWPEDKRTRGVLPDRSRAKNAVRHRVTHVNDFDRELARPPLLTGGAQTFHDDNDASACEAVYQREMSYIADEADVSATHRRDICPKYDRMLGRGRDSVQGLRALSQDLAVRGSVGLGFVETKSMVEHSVEQREARASDGTKEKPDRGPRLDHRTVNVHNSVTERLLRGRPLVRGTGLNDKRSPLMKKDNCILTNAFKRSPSLPGFDSRSKFGGTRILSRTPGSSIAIPGWAPSDLENLL